MKCLVAIVLVLWTVSLSRADVVFTDDTVITEADNLSHVHVYDGASGSTSVTMTGGTIEGLVLHDTSSFEQTGGFVAVPHAAGGSTLTILDGSAAAITVDDQATAAIHGGEIHFFAEAGGAAVLSITGGLFEADLFARPGDDQPLQNLSQGWAHEIDQGVINVYGSGFLYDPTGAGPDGFHAFRSLA